MEEAALDGSSHYSSECRTAFCAFSAAHATDQHDHLFVGVQGESKFIAGPVRSYDERLQRRGRASSNAECPARPGLSPRCQSAAGFAVTVASHADFWLLSLC